MESGPKRLGRRTLRAEGEGFQFLSEEFTCSEEPTLDRSFRLLQSLGDLEDFHFLQVTHSDDASIRERQSADCAADLVAQLAGFGQTT